jgi:hypothetical protein
VTSDAELEECLLSNMKTICVMFRRIINEIYNNLVCYIQFLGAADGGTVVKVLCYKSEGRWFDSRWCHWNFSLT